MAREQLERLVDVTEGVTVTVDANSNVVAKGPKGEVTKSLRNPRIAYVVEGNQVKITSISSTKMDKKLINTMTAHVKNLIKGASEGFTYELKICSGHFPMTVAVKGDTLEVKNLFGEAVPRKLKLKEGAKVTVKGDQIEVTGNNIEIVGQVSADIEKLTKRAGFDRRIFQDGIYIVNKNGKLM